MAKLLVRIALVQSMRLGQNIYEYHNSVGVERQHWFVRARPCARMRASQVPAKATSLEETVFKADKACEKIFVMRVASAGPQY